MTGKMSVNQDFNLRNLHKAFKFAQQNGVSTALITGKGEPTLNENEVIRAAKLLNEYFPFIELQTNGSRLSKQFLKRLYDAGVTTIIVSMVHYNSFRNNLIYGYDEPLNLVKLVEKIHDAKLSVRFSCIMFKGFIDSYYKITQLIDFCKVSGVEQLTIRAVETTKNAKDDDVLEWTKHHQFNPAELNSIFKIFTFSEKTTKLMELVHGATVYDYDGQNVCISNCLTLKPEDSTLRQLIIYPNGHIYYDWIHSGAILL
jgi:molybdenum cofactor biosynthesis enzyme MoaA